MVKFKKASADEARAKRKDHTKDAAGGTAIIKGFRAPPSFDATNRSARFIMTSETEDRYGDIVVQSGIDTTRFEENPVALLFHNSRSWPCGNWSNITKVLSGRPKRTEGVLNFLPDGIDPDADRAVAHVAAGTLRTVSIGFIPDWEQIEFILDDDEDWTGGFRYLASELLECSLVPIPAQPDALVKDAGGDMKLARDLIEEILDTYTKTPEGLLIPLDEYRQKHLDLVGARTFTIGPIKFKADLDEQTRAELLAKLRTEFGLIEEADPEMKDDPEEPEDPEEEPADPDAEEPEVEPAEADKAAAEAAKAAAEALEREQADAAAAALAAAPVARAPGPIVIDLDLSEATEKVSAFEKLVDTVAGKLAKLFGTGKTKEADPVVVVPAPPPSDEEMNAATDRAKAIQARLIAKGFVESR